MNKRKTSPLYLLFPFLLLLSVITFFDLRISESLYNPKSNLALFFEAFGELPALIIALSSSSVLLATYEHPRPIKRIINTLGFGFLSLLLSIMLGLKMSRYLNLPMYSDIVLIFVSFIGSMVLVNSLTLNVNKELRTVAKICIITLSTALVSTTLLKIIWGRIPFHLLDHNQSNYTPWYFINGFTFDTERMSFPSSHVASAATIICLSLIPKISVSLNEHTKSFSSLALIWLFLVMISRIILGKNYSTDTLIAAAITITIFLIVKHYYYKENRHYRSV